MLYRPLWFVMQFFYRLYFRRLYIHGVENWVTDKPVILTSNHVNGFMDPVILPTQIWKKVIYIVRGDIFNTPFKRWLLWQMRQLPIFRERDGRDNVQRNVETFKKCHKYLSNNEVIMIFSEGDCVQEKHLRKLKKGTARMAFGTVEQYGWELDLQILPSTVNYTYPEDFRTELILNIGKPIPLKKYKDLYEENPNRAYSALTNDIEDQMKEIYIHLDSRDDLQLFEDLVLIKRSLFRIDTLAWKVKSPDRFNMEQGLSKKINQFRSEAPEKLEPIKNKASNYVKVLKKNRIADRNFAVNARTPATGIAIGILGFPAFALGYLISILPYRWVDNFVRKNIKLDFFRNPIRMGLLMLMSIILGIILVIGISPFSVWLGVTAPILLWGLVYFTIVYHEYMYFVLQQLRFNKLRRENSKEFQDILKTREELLSFIRD